jgi:hypothetical protein
MIVIVSSHHSSTESFAGLSEVQDLTSAMVKLSVPYQHVYGLFMAFSWRL